MVYAVLVVAFVAQLLAVDPVVVGPPAPASSTTTNVTNVTNVFPPPDPAVVVETEKQAAPVILDSGLRYVDSSATSSLGQMFQLALGVARLRKDLILLPAVQEINGGLQRIVLFSLGLVIAALCLWGMIGQYFGSDAMEAFEFLGRVPLWNLLAMSSWHWFGTVLDAFALLGAMIADSANGAFGPTLRPDFWSDAGIAGFSLLVGLFYLFNLFLFALQIFADTAFLAFCALAAPLFIATAMTPWTNHWAKNWFRMVPGTAADLLAMLAILVIGAAGLDRLALDNALATLGFDLGLLLCLPLIRRLCGLEHQPSAGRVFSALFWYRFLRTRGGTVGAAGATTAAAAGSAAASTTAPTRAPRYAHAYGNAATPKRPGYAGVLT